MCLTRAHNLKNTARSDQSGVDRCSRVPCVGAELNSFTFCFAFLVGINMYLRFRLTKMKFSYRIVVTILSCLILVLTLATIGLWYWEKEPASKSVLRESDGRFQNVICPSNCVLCYEIGEGWYTFSGYWSRNTLSVDFRVVPQSDSVQRHPFSTCARVITGMCVQPSAQSQVGCLYAGPARKDQWWWRGHRDRRKGNLPARLLEAKNWFISHCVLLTKLVFHAHTLRFILHFKTPVGIQEKRDGKMKIIVVPHSHNDPGWHKTVDGYFEDQSKLTLDNMLEKLVTYPKMKFVWAETVFLDLWWRDLDNKQRGKKAPTKVQQFLLLQENIKTGCTWPFQKSTLQQSAFTLQTLSRVSFKTVNWRLWLGVGSYRMRPILIITLSLIRWFKVSLLSMK